MNEQSGNMPTPRSEKTDNEFPFQLFRLDSTSFEMPTSDPLPRELDTGGICLCLRGQCNMLLNQQQCQIKAGDLCVFFPRMMLQISNQSDDFEAYGVLTQTGIIREVDVPSSAALFLYISEHPFVYYEILNIFQHGKPLTMHTQSRQEVMFRHFIELVSRHHVQEREIGYYADRLCVTPKYFSSVIRAVTGKSAAWWIRHTVIIHAKNLLKSSQLTIQQISDALQFPNPSCFGQYFKRQTGMTPKEFRRKSF